MPTSANIRFIVYWKKKDSSEDEIKIILPELNFERKLESGSNTVGERYHGKNLLIQY